MVFEYRAFWNGGPGGEGVSVFHGRSSLLGDDEDTANDLVSKVVSLFIDLAAHIPDAYTITYPGEVLEFNTATGTLETVYPVGVPTPTDGAASGDWAAPVGVQLRWFTPAIVAGRRLSGRTYIVPIIASDFQDDGTIDSTALGVFNDAAAAYHDEGVFSNVNPCVWSRTHGILADITSGDCPDKAAILTSRRD